MSPGIYFACSGAITGIAFMTWVRGEWTGQRDPSGIGLLMLAAFVAAAIGEWVS